jgi:hypothetical protein
MIATTFSRRPGHCMPVVISGPFIKNLLHNHFIIEFFFKKKSGEAKDSVIFPFYFLLNKRAKPMHPPYIHPSAHLSTLKPGAL